MSQCCVLCTLVRPACRRSSGEPVASVDVPVVAEHASVSVLGGRSVLQCSARAAASEYCLLELSISAFVTSYQKMSADEELLVACSCKRKKKTC